MSGEEDEERLAADVGDERRCLPADQLFPNAAQLGRIRHRLSMAFNVVGHLAYPPSFGLLAKIPVDSCACATMLLNSEVWYVWATSWSEMS